jgi:hypothetical protein
VSLAADSLRLHLQGFCHYINFISFLIFFIVLLLINVQQQPEWSQRNDILPQQQRRGAYDATTTRSRVDDTDLRLLLNTMVPRMLDALRFSAAIYGQ